jgi:hypothetical protein
MTTKNKIKGFLRNKKIKAFLGHDGPLKIIHFKLNWPKTVRKL